MRDTWKTNRTIFKVEYIQTKDQCKVSIRRGSQNTRAACYELLAVVRDPQDVGTILYNEIYNRFNEVVTDQTKRTEWGEVIQNQ